MAFRRSVSLLCEPRQCGVCVLGHETLEDKATLTDSEAEAEIAASAREIGTGENHPAAYWNEQSGKE